KTKPITMVLTAQPIPEPTLKTLLWLHDFYPSPLGLVAQQALPSGLALSKPPKIPPPIPSAEKASIPLPSLSPQQQQAYDAITSDSDHRSFLVHGDTGTG